MSLITMKLYVVFLLVCLILFTSAGPVTNFHHQCILSVPNLQHKCHPPSPKKYRSPKPTSSGSKSFSSIYDYRNTYGYRYPRNLRKRSSFYPNRPAYPWESPDNVYERPGHDLPILLPHEQAGSQDDDNYDHDEIARVNEESDPKANETAQPPSSSPDDHYEYGHGSNQVNDDSLGESLNYPKDKRYSVQPPVPQPDSPQKCNHDGSPNDQRSSGKKIDDHNTVAATKPSDSQSEVFFQYGQSSGSTDHYTVGNTLDHNHKDKTYPNGRGSLKTTKPLCQTRVPYTGAEGQTYIPGYGGEELIHLPLPNDDKPFTMTLLHTNDIHAHMDEFSSSGLDCTPDDYAKKNCFGGIARIKWVVDKMRLTHPHTYLFDAGDQFQGNLFYSYYKGNVTAEFMNAIGYDVFAVGNHEFDDGPAHLAKFLRLLEAPTISSNIDVSSDPELEHLVAPYVVLTKYGIRIGVVGFITKTLADITNIGENVRFFDPVAPVQTAVDKLRSMGINRIICVSHNGYEDDIYLAKHTRGFDLIVGGHSHTLLHNNYPEFPGAKGPYPTIVKNLDSKDAYIVQAKVWGEWLGHLEISWDADGGLTYLNGEAIHLTMDIPQNTAYQSTVKKWRVPFDKMAKRKLGENLVELSNHPCKFGNCGLGWLAAEALRTGYMQLNEPKHLPVIGMMHEGGLRAILPEGKISLLSILTVFPFSDPWAFMTVTGEWIRELLENLAAGNHTTNHRRVTSFAQFSGLGGAVNRSEPEFKQVSNVEILHPDGSWLPLNDQNEYIIVLPEFVALGGDNIVPNQISFSQGDGTLSDVVSKHIETIKVINVPKEPGFEVIKSTN